MKTIYIAPKQFKFYCLIVVTFIAVHLACNSVVQKIIPFFSAYVPISAFIFSFVYILGDVVAEVYGYAHAKRLIWLDIYAQLLFAAIISLSLKHSSPVFWKLGSSYNDIFGAVFSQALGSCVAVFCSSMINAYLISKCKIFMKGRVFWIRSIFASTISEGILVTIAYSNTLSFSFPFSVILKSILTAWVIKFLCSIILVLPAAIFVNYLKKKEGFDIYDYEVNYNPFILGIGVEKNAKIADVD